MVLYGEGSFIKDDGLEMAEKFMRMWEGVVGGSGHWVVEDNPEGFVQVLEFIEG